MDIHLPKPPRSVSEFAIEIGTITIGILIALTLESVVTALHNRDIVEKSRAQLVTELKTNRDHLTEVVQTADADVGALHAYISYGEDRLHHKAHALPTAPLPGDFTTLGTSAWESTVATNALVHMPFDQASAVAGAYASARAFNSLEERIEDRWFELSSIGDPSDLTNADLRRVVGQLRIAYAYQTAAAQAGNEVLHKYDVALAALKG
jgi:hypothetical protein